jgi:hypothetical protein
MNELVRGKKYRIEHKLGLFNPRLGTFVRSYTENSCHDFDRIIRKNNFNFSCKNNFKKS